METVDNEELDEENPVDDEDQSDVSEDGKDSAPDAGSAAGDALTNGRAANRHTELAIADAAPSGEDDVDHAQDSDESDVLDLSDTDDRSGSASSAQSHSSFNRRSRAPSPTDSLVEHAASLRLDPAEEAEGASGSPPTKIAAEPAAEAPTIRERVAADIGRHQARQTSKYHSKRGVKKIGRPKGSKAKQDMRVKVDRHGEWD